jgi:pyridoxal phosphate enzyme (YggS family)
MPPVTPISDNIARVRERIRAALGRAGRASADVTIVAVTKTFGAEIVREVIEAGITDVGENRVQELLAKQESLGRNCRWHLVGPLQRNKAGKVVGRVDLIHSIDGVRIAQTVDRIARERGTRVRVLLEVNTSREASKHGATVEETRAVADAIAGLESLDLSGVMTIGPLSGGEAAARECFRTLTRLATELRVSTGRPLPVISMGMSDDFEVAIEEGATMLRLGRVLLGERS